MGLTQQLGTIPLAIQTNSSNNVGIGAAASGSFKLQVTGTTNLTGALTGTSATFSGDLTLNNGSADGGQLVLASSGFSNWNLDNFSGRFRAYYGATEYFTIASTGSVGIGTTPPTTTNFSHLFVGKNISMFSGSSTDIYIGSNFYYDGGFKVRYSEASAMINTNAGDFIFQNSSSGTAGGTFNGIERMRITNTGNVGIGTSSPASLLNIVTSNTTAYDSTVDDGQAADGSTITIRNSSTVNNTFAQINMQVSGDSGRALGRIVTIRTASATSDMAFVTESDNTKSEKMRITSGGKVMVNTTDSGPNAYLFASANMNQPYPLGAKAENTSQGLVGFFDNGNNTIGSISRTNDVVSYNSFLGSHWSQLQDDTESQILKGTVLDAIDELCEWEGEINDRLAKVKISDTVESKNVYGVFLGWDNMDDYNDMYVAALGAGYIRVNQNEVISMGDLLQSNGDGTAKVQSDDIIRSSTIAKVVSTQKIETYPDGSYLIAATLHCG